jgi:formate dehydrogenase assembly factor FdhD
LDQGFKKSKANNVVATPVDISINSRHFVTLMCTPSDLEVLAVGFLTNEGLINSAEDLNSQELHSYFGGVLSSGLSDGRNLLVVMEDISRQCAMDKSETPQKTGRIGSSEIIFRTAPVPFPLKQIKKMGICLNGYA